MKALLGKGFRPFFLLGGAYACVVVPTWILILRGHLTLTGGAAGPQWHAHEMVHGFALSIIAGFLLTAVSNWTGKQTLVGMPLGVLAGVWIAARVIAQPWSGAPPALFAAVDLLFLPLLTLGIARPIASTRNRRNYGFIVVLSVMWLTNLLYHLDALRLVEAPLSVPAMRIALDLVIVIVAIVTGRIIPNFTRNATGAEWIRSVVWADRLTVGGLVVLALFHVAEPPVALVSVVAGVTGLAALVRMTRWGFTATLRDPILWVLHVGHLWIGLGLLLRAAAPWASGLGGSGATHALAIGVVGTLTLGMMVRVALGHTGRRIAAPTVATIGFVLVTAAAAVRVGFALFGTRFYQPSLDATATLWTIAFGLYLIRFVPVLIKPRPDGRPG